jgi:hypothetical protein
MNSSEREDEEYLEAAAAEMGERPGLPVVRECLYCEAWFRPSDNPKGRSWSDGFCSRGCEGDYNGDWS